MRTHIIAAALFALALACPASAQLDILIYDDTGTTSGFGAPYYENFVDAITNLGHTPHIAADEGAFNSMLTGGMNWDMVICDVGNYPNALTTLDNIQTYLNAGNPVIYGHWQASNYASHPLFAQEGVLVGAAIGGSPPATIDDWTGSSIFNSPNAVPQICCGSGGMYGIYAQQADVGGAAVAHGGYAGPMPSPNNAAVILGESGRFIFNAFALDPYTGVDSDSDMKDDIVELAENEIQFLLGPSCRFNVPTAGGVVMDDVILDFDTADPESDPLTGTFEWSTDAGVTWQPCLEGVGSPHTNPTSVGALLTPGTEQFIWDSDVDGVGLIVTQATQIRVSLIDPGGDMGGCMVDVDVDNEIPLPVCTVTEPSGTQSGPIDFDLTLLSINSPMVDFVADFSTDGGTTWSMATAATSSAWPNPATGVPVGLATFTWDSRADGVAMGGLVPGVLMRITVNDNAAPPPIVLTSECISGPFDVDNAQLCALCGDCDQNSVGPDVLDALAGAQIAAGLFTPTVVQAACCDIDSAGGVTVIDALGMAQAAAGLPITLVCQ